MYKVSTFDAKSSINFFGRGFISEFSVLISNIKSSLENSALGTELSSLREMMQGENGRNSVIYNTEIVQNIGTATPATAYESAEQSRRVMENLENYGVM